MPQILLIIQARMGSTRLPGKILLPISGKPLIWYLVERIKSVKSPVKTLIATTISEKDQELVQFCKVNHIDVFRGNENDVLDRFYQASKVFKGDIIVRITGDCPMTDPTLIDKAIEIITTHDYDYVNNVNPPTYPDGLDIEVFLFKALEHAWKEAKLPSEREHVTPYIWKHPEIFKIENMRNDQDWSNFRFTVDEKEDFIFIAKLIEQFIPRWRDFKTSEVIDYLNKNKQLLPINQKFARNEGLTKSINEDHKYTAPLKQNSGAILWQKAKKLIPGGTQLLSKRSEMFLPDQWPSYFDHANGVMIWDLDGNPYYDMSIMGVGANILGYCDEDVNQAVKQVIDKGSMSTLNSPEEVELAELLLKIHPWAQKVRFVRTGGEAMAVAVRIARAAAKSDVIAFCGYHGWHDWYLSTNLIDKTNLDQHLLSGLDPKGVPKELASTAIPFEYNRIDQLEKIIQKYNVGVIVVEPVRHTQPENGFLMKVREIANKIGAILVFDEITIGFRMNVGGVHLYYKIYPDIAVFAKAMSNGYPMGAIIGIEAVMEAAQTSFISSTYWTERIGPTAAIATIKKMISHNVPQYIDKIGGLIADGWRNLARKHYLDINILWPNCLVTFAFNYPNALEIKTLFTQEMLKLGFLAGPSVYVSFAHTEEIVKKYLYAVDIVFGIIKRAISENNIKELLKGPVIHSGFQRLT